MICVSVQLGAPTRTLTLIVIVELESQPSRARTAAPACMARKYSGQIVAIVCVRFISIQIHQGRKEEDVNKLNRPTVPPGAGLANQLTCSKAWRTRCRSLAARACSPMCNLRASSAPLPSPRSSASAYAYAYACAFTLLPSSAAALGLETEVEIGLGAGIGDSVILAALSRAGTTRTRAQEEGVENGRRERRTP